MSSRARELLAAGGPLAEHLAGYERRPGQLAMADAVEEALESDRVLLCEAGTGTGKTLAYLVPAILSGKKVIVSTATRALQEQIWNHDLPLVKSALGLEPRAAMMKGLANYVCRRRLGETRRRMETLPMESRRALVLVDEWQEQSARGDISELAALAEDAAIWRDVTSSSDTRVGARCTFYEECFVTNMKRRAEAARLVIVNHHLFFADLALRGPHPGRVIPDYDAVIFDEAHQLEDIATNFFGVRVSSSRVISLLLDAERALLLAGDSARLIPPARRAADAFFAQLGRVAAGEGRSAVDRETFMGPMADCWHELDNALDAVASAAESVGGSLLGRAASADVLDALSVVERRARQLRDQLAVAIDGAPGHVAWFERGPRSSVLSATPVDLSTMFRERVFETVPAAVLTSATLATEAADANSETPFKYLRSRLGLAGDDVAVSEAVVPSPFDFQRHALLYTPKDLPSPRSPEFISAAAERVRALVEITDGGAFVLTTSHRSLRAFAQLLRGASQPVLMQGEAPKAALLERFRSSGRAVLVATQSFWEGVDVPGHALRLVVLEKVPFAVPTDPVLMARSRAIEEEGGNPFMDLSVPSAAIALKQGFGRLIRTAEDAGIVALLDERVHRRGYGRRLLAALPPARRSHSLEEVRDFWQDVTETL